MKRSVSRGQGQTPLGAWLAAGWLAGPGGSEQSQGDPPRTQELYGQSTLGYTPPGTTWSVDLRVHTPRGYMVSRP